MKRKYRAVFITLLAVTLSLGLSSPSLHGFGLEPGGSTDDVTGTLSILYYSSREKTLTLKLEIQAPVSETYDFDVECRVYTNPADPAERVMLKNDRFEVRGGSDGKATKIIKFELDDPLPKAHILSWYVYDYQEPAE